jgi:predicted DNA-binding transcriptional regulator AlpA
MTEQKISYNEKEVEALTGLKVKTLQQWRSLNRGPRFVRLGRCVRYPADSLRAWINSRPGGGESEDAVMQSRRKHVAA